MHPVLHAILSVLLGTVALVGGVSALMVIVMTNGWFAHFIVMDRRLRLFSFECLAIGGPTTIMLGFILAITYTLGRAILDQ